MKWLLVFVACPLLVTCSAKPKADKKENKKPKKDYISMKSGFSLWEIVAAGASTSVAWCYHLPDCNETTWSTISQNYCDGTRQSPIDIVSADATGDPSLGLFNFTNYGSNSSMTNASNTGRTIKVGLSGVSISGGGLAEAYDSLQLHLHWGNGSSIGGSEHTVDGKRYPMELHIVNAKAIYNGDCAQAVQDSTGLAALGFFIEEMPGNETASPATWKTLTDYLANITQKDQSVQIAAGVSLDDLLSGVDRTKYYRYLGSLTTPSCNEAVVWTVFKEPIKVSKDLIDLFSSTLHVGDSTSEMMTNVFRGLQPSQNVTTQLATTSAGSTTVGGSSLGIMALCLLVRISV